MVRSKLDENAENPNSVASCNEQHLCDTGNLDNCARTSSTSHEPSRRPPLSCSCYSDPDRYIINPLVRSFLSSLHAKKIAGPRGCITFVLQPDTYAKTLESLRESDPDTWEYVNLKLRHDVIDDKYLVIKMITPIHEIITDMINESIKTQLITIKETSNEPTKQLIQRIRALRCASIKLYGSGGLRQPDDQFTVRGCFYPGVVIEMACSQSFESLRSKAQNLIVNSDGNIRIVIGLEAENGGVYKISAWRPDFIQSENGNTVRSQTVIEQDTIRDVDGKLKPGSMTFQLRDFGSNLAASFPNANLTRSITLRYNDLVDYLVEAEEFQNQKQPPGPKNIGNVEQSSPIEELTPEDEKKFRHREKKSSPRSKALDPDY